ncbi:MAG: glycosyltransferase, partial [Tepidisphaeraceae bacterium]
MPDHEAPDPLPIHFFTIVLDGQPFIRYHLNVFKHLPFDWHWHIIEGVADHVHDTAWSLKNNAKIPPAYASGQSLDGTTEYLDQIAAENPTRVKLYRKPLGHRWNGKREMANAPLPNISCECLLWQIDADELWTLDQLIAARKLFLDHPEKTAAFYWCWFFVGPDRLLCTRNSYANDPRIEWLRTWRYKPGMQWTSHEPPILTESVDSAPPRNVATVNPFLHHETEAAGLVFQHFAYTTLPQLTFKESYYGYPEAVPRWLALQAADTFPLPLQPFFPWSDADAQVDLADYYIDPLLDLRPAGLVPPDAPPARKPTILLDTLFFQLDQKGGVARVWTSILPHWIESGFAANLVILDRAAKAPRYPDLRYRTILAYDPRAPEADARFLQRICDEEKADLFISTYYTSPLTTPSIFMAYDMIPEVQNFDLNFWRWQLKHRGIRHASSYVSISESTKNDLLHFFPQISPEKIKVIYCGVDPAYHPRPKSEVAALLARLNINKPYFLMVNVTEIP